MKRVTLMDLFAGCGGMTLGFRDAGYVPHFAVEHDVRAAATYDRNFGAGHMHAADIAQIERFPASNVIVGGPPCQGFSALGRAQGDARDARNHLWREYARAVEQAAPRVFVMENVPQLLKSEHFLAFAEHAKDLGYTIETRTLLASDYGVAQNRSRAIVIGALDPSLIRWPSPTHGDAPSLPARRTVRDAIGDLPLAPTGRNWHSARPSIEGKSLLRYSHVPADGGNRFQMEQSLDEAGLGHLVPACWRGRSGKGVDVFGRLWWDRPSVTIRTEFHKPEKGRYLHPVAPRPLTLREGARLQGFPDTFTWPDDQTMSHVARQIGNAVPPPMAYAIARALLPGLHARS